MQRFKKFIPTSALMKIVVALLVMSVGTFGLMTNSASASTFPPTPPYANTTTFQHDYIVAIYVCAGSLQPPCFDTYLAEHSSDIFVREYYRGQLYIHYQEFSNYDALFNFYLEVFGAMFKELYGWLNETWKTIVCGYVGDGGGWVIGAVCEKALAVVPL